MSGESGERDVKAAAERLRRIGGGEPSKVVYGFVKSANDPVYDDGDFEHLAILRRKDAERLADAYLAETDPTPADEAWLLSVGFMDDEHGALFVGGRGDNAITWLRKTGTTFVNGRSVETNPSRGTILTLARALSIGLKEPRT